MKARLLLPVAFGFLFAAPSLAQVPNGGFENWSTVGTYLDPDGWITFNNLTSLGGASPSCAQGSPGAVGSYYATVTSQNTAFGVIQGVLISGNATTGVSGFPYSSRPAAMTGQWQYNIQPNDSGLVVVYMTKWNTATMSADSVGGGAIQVTGSLSGWHPLNVPITYFTSANPDTAMIAIVSSAGDSVTAGSFISVDALGFGVVSGVVEADQVPSLRIYPSPAADVVNITAATPIADVEVMDLTGRTVVRKTLGAAGSTLDVADLPTGRYLVQVRMADGKRQVRSFVKQ